MGTIDVLFTEYFTRNSPASSREHVLVFVSGRVLCRPPAALGASSRELTSAYQVSRPFTAD